MPAPAVRGTQTLARAVALLKAVSTRPNQGWRLTDLAAHCGYDKGTAHRLLAGLVAERLLRQRGGDKHYLPGPLMFELGLDVPHMNALRAACLPALNRLAKATRSVAYLYLLSGEEFVCAAQVGTSDLKGLSVEVGTRRPLAVSAIGVAMLLALPENEQKQVLAANLRQIGPIGPARLRAVQDMLRMSRRHGFGINLGDVVPGIYAFGVPLKNAGGQVFAAIGVTGPAEAYPAARVGQMQTLLETDARSIEAENPDLMREI